MSISSWNVPPPTYDAHSTTTSLTPYLQLPHLLSLTWLAYPILSLVFVAFRLQLSLASAQDAVSSAKDQLLTSCKAAEDAATSTASMPRYMALATNKQYADAINASMNAARAALVLSLTAMEAIINFIIDFYRSTLLCFLEFVVRGGLSILIGAVQEVNNLLSSATTSLRTGIQNDIASANKIIKTAIDAINKVNPFGDISAPQINIPSLDGLQNVTLPASFEDALTKLNSSLPSVSDIKNTVEDVIDAPFELLKKDINDTFASISFEPEGLPVPEINRLSFCNQLDPSVIDDVGHDLIKTAKIGVVVLILLALLLIALNCLLTWYKWRCMKDHLEYTRQAWLVDPTMIHATSKSTSAPQISMSDHNLMMLNANSEHPLITKITNQLSARLRLTPSQHTHTQWFFNYIFHAPALACFLIGFFGIMSIQIQLLAMGPLIAKYQARTAATISDFSTTIATSINQSMYNQSSLYANEVNSRVDEIQSTINDGVFGWVNGTTTTLNSTINTFYTDIQNAVTTVFGGTILESPANAFLKCFIGSKVDAIENALTFLHDNLHVDMPRINQSVLILSPDSINEVSQPIAAAAIGGGGDDNDGLLMRLVNAYAESLRKERVMFAIFLALWGVVVLMGLCVVLWHSFGRSYLEKRGRRKWEAEQRTGLENVRPFNGEEGDVKTTNKEFRSFSPLPSPKGSAFKPFWSSRSNSPSEMNNNTFPSSSIGSVTQHNQTEMDETTYSQPREAPIPVVVAEKRKTGKLLAIGRRAMSRGAERLKKDGTDEELSVPLSPLPISEPVGEHRRNTVWYDKMATLLVRKEPAPAKNENVDFWDESAMVQNEKNRPKLQVYTQRGLDKYGPPPRQSQPPQEPPQSRWSASPGPTQTTWMNIMSPTKKAPPVPTPPPAVVITQEPETPLYQPHPPIGVPIRSRPIQNANVPLDVGLAYDDDDDPFMAPAPKSNPIPPPLPMPLYNGFNSPENPHSYPSPPRHPALQARFSQGRKRQDSSPPPPLKSPRMFTPQLALAPPPANDRRQTRSTSWRVTNAAPGDTASLTSSSSPEDVEGDMATTPVTRLLTTTHARHSSSVNPFITPFDDEHRVQIDHPTGAATRKSMATNPFTAHAM